MTTFCCDRDGAVLVLALDLQGGLDAPDPWRISSILLADDPPPGFEGEQRL